MDFLIHIIIMAKTFLNVHLRKRRLILRLCMHPVDGECIGSIGNRLPMAR